MNFSAEIVPIEFGVSSIFPAVKIWRYQGLTSPRAASLYFDWSALNSLVVLNILHLIFLSIYEPPPEGPLLFSTHFITIPHFLFASCNCPFPCCCHLLRYFHRQRLQANPVEKTLIDDIFTNFSLAIHDRKNCVKCRVDLLTPKDYICSALLTNDCFLCLIQQATFFMLCCDHRPQLLVTSIIWLLGHWRLF